MNLKIILIVTALFVFVRVPLILSSLLLLLLLLLLLILLLFHFVSSSVLSPHFFLKCQILPTPRSIFLTDCHGLLPGVAIYRFQQCRFLLTNCICSFPDVPKVLRSAEFYRQILGVLFFATKFAISPSGLSYESGYISQFHLPTACYSNQQGNCADKDFILRIYLFGYYIYFQFLAVSYHFSFTSKNTKPKQYYLTVSYYASQSPLF